MGGQKGAAGATRVKFSVLIPARNAEKTIGRCLQSVRATSYPLADYEVVVVNDGSADRTAEIAEAYGARVVRMRGTSIAAVRNRAAREAQGEVIAHLDSDMLVDPRWLAKADEYYFQRDHRGALHFEDRAPEDARWIGRLWYGPIRKRKPRVREVGYLPTRGLFVNKDLHEALGGFDEELFKGKRGGSDKEFTYRLRRAGYSLIADPSLNMIHLGCESTLAGFLKKETWHQGSTLLIARKFGYPFRLLRNPLLSAYHVICWAGLVAALVLGPVWLGLVFAALWGGASLFLALAQMDLRKFWMYLPSVWLVNFLRWNVAGFALIPQVFQIGELAWRRHK
jgi:glycosyltransferase involved in cell wall biosynthesis